MLIFLILHSKALIQEFIPSTKTPPAQVYSTTLITTPND